MGFLQVVAAPPGRDLNSRRRRRNDPIAGALLLPSCAKLPRQDDAGVGSRAAKAARINKRLGHWPRPDDAGRGCIRKRHAAMPSEVVTCLRRLVPNSIRSTGSRPALLAIICCHDIASKRPRSDSQRFGCSSLMDLRYGTHCTALLYRAARPGDEWARGDVKSKPDGSEGRESCRGWVMATRATASMIWSRK